VVNRSLGNILRCLVRDNIRSWDQRLCQAEFAHNTAVGRATGFSPFQIVYGVQPRGPCDLAPLPSSGLTDPRASDLVAELLKTHTAARARLESSTAAYKRAADSRRRHVEFEVGDFVWAVLTKDRFPAHEFNKLAARKIGPVEVVEKINPNAYRLRLPSHIRTSDVFNVKHLVPFAGDNSEEDETGSDSRPNPSQPGEDDGDETAIAFPRVSEDLKDALSTFQQTFVVSDATKPDYPIMYASAGFFNMTGYTSKEVIGRNCRFLQGKDTDPDDVAKIREALRYGFTYCGRLLNYKKGGTPFWNLLTIAPIKDETGNVLKYIGMQVEVSKHTEGIKEKMTRPNGLPESLIRYDARQKEIASNTVTELVEAGEVQYFIGVQLDGSQHVEPLHNCIPEATAAESAKLVKTTAENVDVAVRELPDANTKPEDLWKNHSKIVHPKPHRRNSPSWDAIQKILDGGEEIGLKHFKPIKPLGSGDTGSVHLVELCGTGQLFAMKAMDKGIILNRNKVHRACAEREILDMLDHPFLPALYASFQTKTHICLITDYCPGGELFLLLDKQRTKVLKEDAVKFYAAEVIVALEYLHCQGIIYRDLKPENVLLQDDGHISLTDFDLSCLTSCKPQLLIPEINEKKRNQKGQKGQQAPVFMAEPMRASNSFVGTEEYIAPEIITGAGHTSAVDWWALGILLYEMLYGYTPFRGKTRQKTFANVLHKDLKFPRNKEVSLQAKQLMYRLLHRDPKNRLGSREGANEVKQHPFFRGINWALVRCMNPPTLDSPLFKEKETDADPGLDDLQKNVF
ncbi:Phototropin-1, partial [Striga hermonthica]